MGCAICGEHRSYRLFQRGVSYCKEHFIAFFEGEVEKTIREFSLFDRSERIMVSVSGGKDSLVLAMVLLKLGYSIKVFHIDLGIGEYSEISKEKVISFVKDLNIPYSLVSVKDIFGCGIKDIAKKVKRPFCSVCGTIKRYLMDRSASGMVVATGHNLDDEVSFLVSNYINWSLGYIRRQGPLLREEHGFSRKVKPLSLVYEYETALYAAVNGIDYVIDECPLSEGATTLAVKRALNMIEREVPDIKLTCYKAYLRQKQNLNISTGESVILSPCEKCGYPTTTKICLFCRFVDRVIEHQNPL